MPVTVTDVRKALEDMITAGQEVTHRAKEGVTVCPANTDVSVAFSGDPYESADQYVINMIEALDTDGIDIRLSIEIKDKTGNGFVFNSPRATTVTWNTNRIVPKFEYHTP